MKTDIKKLALSGLLGGALAIGGTACSKDEDKKKDDKANAPKPTAPVKATKPATPKPDKKPVAAKPDVKKDAAKYSELHACAGMNVCKGLGGCKVTAEKLTALAKAAGVDLAKAGAAHECKGMNECKGLGGCSVDEAKLAILKEKLAKKAKGEAPAPKK